MPVTASGAVARSLWLRSAVRLRPPLKLLCQLLSPERPRANLAERSGGLLRGLQAPTGNSLLTKIYRRHAMPPVPRDIHLHPC